MCQIKNIGNSITSSYTSFHRKHRIFPSRPKQNTGPIRKKASFNSAKPILGVALDPQALRVVLTTPPTSRARICIFPRRELKLISGRHFICGVVVGGCARSHAALAPPETVPRRPPPGPALSSAPSQRSRTEPHRSKNWPI